MDIETPTQNPFTEQFTEQYRIYTPSIKEQYRKKDKSNSCYRFAVNPFHPIYSRIDYKKDFKLQVLTSFKDNS
jgi:hypothetical protein